MDPAQCNHMSPLKQKRKMEEEAREMWQRWKSGSERMREAQLTVADLNGGPQGKHAKQVNSASYLNGLESSVR